jgi:hypothetical protein
MFKNDPSTETDDRIALIAARNDFISTISGSLVSVLGALSPLVVSLVPGVPIEVRLTSWAGGSIIGGAGAAIARQSPLKVSQSISSARRSSQSVSEVEIEQN